MVDNERRQFNMRLTDGLGERLDRMRMILGEKMGIKVSNADVFRLAMTALEQQHLPSEGKRGKAKL